MSKIINHGSQERYELDIEIVSITVEELQEYKRIVADDIKTSEIEIKKEYEYF